MTEAQMRRRALAVIAGLALAGAGTAIAENTCTCTCNCVEKAPLPGSVYIPQIPLGPGVFNATPVYSAANPYDWTATNTTTGTSISINNGKAQK